MKSLSLRSVKRSHKEGHMHLQPLAPIQQISILRTGRSFHFDGPREGRLAVRAAEHVVSFTQVSLWAPFALHGGSVRALEVGGVAVLPSWMGWAG